MQDEIPDFEVERRLEAWAAGQSREGISPELVRKLQDALKPTLRPVRPLPSRNKLVLAMLLIFLAGTAGLVLIMEKTGLRSMTAVQIAALCAILATGGILCALKVTAEMSPAARHNIPLWAAVAPAGLAALAVLATLFPWETRGNFVSEGWPCAMTEILTAVPATIVFWLVARRGALFASAGLGAALASLAVFLALAPLQSQCMFPQAPHLLVWHGGTAVVLIGLGAVLGEWRRRSSRF